MADERSPNAVQKQWPGWAIGMAAMAALFLTLFLVPFAYPGERIVLILCLCAFWTCAIATAWPDRFLRMVVLALAAVELFPIRSGATRTALIAGVGLLWIGLLVANRAKRPVIAGLASAPLLIALLLLLPGRSVDANELRKEYVRSLVPYRGAVYIWGGENRIGIDCSGLVRCGWIDANLRLGLRTANPALVRTALRTWLQDCSAQELGEGYRDRTRPVLAVRSLNGADYGALAAGDVAVSSSGTHTLAYLGNRIWIEAEPIYNGVKLAHVPVKDDVWFETPMRIVRWRELELRGTTVRVSDGSQPLGELPTARR